MVMFAFALDTRRRCSNGSRPGWSGWRRCSACSCSSSGRSRSRPTTARSTPCGSPASTRPAIFWRQGARAGRPAACARGGAARRRRSSSTAPDGAGGGRRAARHDLARRDLRAGRRRYALRRPCRWVQGPRDVAPAAPAPGGGARSDRSDPSRRSGARHRSARRCRRAGPGWACSSSSPSPSVSAVRWPSGRWSTNNSTMTGAR